MSQWIYHVDTFRRRDGSESREVYADSLVNAALAMRAIERREDPERYISGWTDWNAKTRRTTYHTRT